MVRGWKEEIFLTMGGKAELVGVGRGKVRGNPLLIPRGEFGLCCS